MIMIFFMNNSSDRNRVNITLFERDIQHRNII